MKCYLPHVTHLSRMTFRSDCRHDDDDSQVNVSLPCYMRLGRRLLPSLFPPWILPRVISLLLLPTAPGVLWVKVLLCPCDKPGGTRVKESHGICRRSLHFDLKVKVSFLLLGCASHPPNKAPTRPLMPPQGEALASVGLLVRCFNMSSWLAGLLQAAVNETAISNPEVLF